VRIEILEEAEKELDEAIAYFQHTGFAERAIFLTPDFSMSAFARLSFSISAF
jgi:predicted deacetylase